MLDDAARERWRSQGQSAAAPRRAAIRFGRIRGSARPENRTGTPLLGWELRNYGDRELR